MPVFAYAATAQSGKIVRGRCAGDDEAFVTERLGESGYTVTQLVLEDESYRPDPIIAIVNSILMYAVKDGASDIIIEPQQKRVRIQYRIDGVLKEQTELPEVTGDMLEPFVSRIKLMADLNITERHISQDGRIHIQMHDKHYDLHVGTSPTQYGEKVAIRIVDGGV